MSFNCYRMEERIFMSEKPTEFYGWYITNGDESFSTAVFPNREAMHELIREVRQRFPRVANGEIERFAAALTLDVVHDTDVAAKMRLGRLENAQEIPFEWGDYIVSLMHPEINEAA